MFLKVSGPTVIAPTRPQVTTIQNMEKTELAPTSSVYLAYLNAHCRWSFALDFHEPSCVNPKVLSVHRFAEVATVVSVVWHGR